MDVDAEEGGGGEEGDDASSVRSSKSGGYKGKVGRPHKEGEVLLLRGKLREEEHTAQEAERRATAAERDRDHLQAHAREPMPKAGAQGQQQEEQTESGGDRCEGGRWYEVPFGGKPGLEGPSKEGEGGPLSSGRHCEPAATLERRADLRVGGAGVSRCHGQP